jgi:hypothetical protein
MSEDEDNPSSNQHMGILYRANNAHRPTLTTDYKLLRKYQQDEQDLNWDHERLVDQTATESDQILYNDGSISRNRGMDK